MWRSRKKEDIPDEDAELRDLIKTYSRLHENKSLPTNKAPLTPPKTQSSKSSPSQNTLLELSPEEIIQGKSISFTRAEAKLYADEEPCDTWRHIDEWFHHHLPLHMGSDYYRYGARRSPVPYWQELRFCISTKNMTPLEAKVAIGRRRNEKLARLRLDGSSEDIWEMRKKPLENPFPLAASQLSSEEKEKGKLT